VRIDILTLFPDVFRGPLEASIIGRAAEAGLVQFFVHDIREHAEGRHKVVDDYPYGGGPGMVMKPDPIFRAVESVTAQADEKGRVVLLTPQGRLLSQAVAEELAGEQRLLLICGHYEGVDERVRQHLVDDEVSIGDYVLSGGEFPALVLVDAVVRRLPGALGSEVSLEEESHAGGLLEYPQYTRPAEFRGWHVPDMLLSGHHAEIARWRHQQSLLRTARRRPDLLARAELANDERRWLEERLAEEEGPPLEGAVGRKKTRTALS
jgi:tRNA (guanine37-N1)-methyltransferase